MAISSTFGNQQYPYAESNFTRPADTTAYASGDLVANDTTAGNVTPMTHVLPSDRGGHCHIRRVRLRKSGTSITNASFRIHFFTSVPAFSNGDNGAFAPNNPADYLGWLDVNSLTAFSNGAAGWVNATVSTECIVEFAVGATLYTAIEARGAYTPGSAEIFYVMPRLAFGNHESLRP